MPGFLGVDYRPGPEVDRVVDLTVHPWPFADWSFDRVRAWHVLEHLPGYELDRAMREIYRVLMPSGVLYVKVPYKEPGPYTPFHFHVFNRRTFDSWIPREGRSTLQGTDIGFRRLRQDVVTIGAFPVWHIARYLPWTEGVLFQRDERGEYSRIPGVARELREWLEKPSEGPARADWCGRSE